MFLLEVYSDEKKSDKNYCFLLTVRIVYVKDHSVAAPPNPLNFAKIVWAIIVQNYTRRVLNKSIPPLWKVFEVKISICNVRNMSVVPENSETLYNNCCQCQSFFSVSSNFVWLPMLTTSYNAKISLITRQYVHDEHENFRLHISNHYNYIKR